jgi:Protein of unknown function (DUF3429)
MTAKLPKPARQFGYAGLLPQAICVMLMFTSPENSWFALAGGFAYAAAIFSFLGGVWWGQAVARNEQRIWIYMLAVMPSLISVAAFMPWTLRWLWPGPSLMLIGVCILVSPFIDSAAGYQQGDWLKLRWHLSLGLGILTTMLGWLA